MVLLLLALLALTVSAQMPGGLGGFTLPPGFTMPPGAYTKAPGGGGVPLGKTGTFPPGFTLPPGMTFPPGIGGGGTLPPGFTLPPDWNGSMPPMMPPGGPETMPPGYTMGPGDFTMEPQPPATPKGTRMTMPPGYDTMPPGVSNSPGYSGPPMPPGGGDPSFTMPPGYTKPPGGFTKPPGGGGGTFPPGFTLPPGMTFPPGIGGGGTLPPGFTLPSDWNGSLPPSFTRPPGGNTLPPGFTMPPGYTLPPGASLPPGFTLPPGGSTFPPGFTIPPRPTFPPYTRPPRPTDVTKPMTPMPTPKICNMSKCMGRGTNTFNATKGMCDCKCNGQWVGGNCEWCPTKYAQDGTCSVCAPDRSNFPVCDFNFTAFAAKCGQKCATAGCGNNTLIVSNGVPACQCSNCKPAPRACSAANLSRSCTYPVTGKCLSLKGQMKCAVGNAMVDCVEMGCTGGKPDKGEDDAVSKAFAMDYIRNAEKADATVPSSSSPAVGAFAAACGAMVVLAGLAVAAAVMRRRVVERAVQDGAYEIH